MTRREQLYDYMKTHADEYLKVLEGAVRLETPTEGDRADLDRCRAYYRDLFEGIGCVTHELKSLNPRFADHLLIEYGKDAGKAWEEISAWRDANRATIDAIYKGKASLTDLPSAPYGGADSKRLMFGGHYDTVHEKGIFGEPWIIDGGHAIGPGALDMKGGDCMVWMILKAFRDLGLFPADAHIVFLLNSDEEAGSYGSSEYFRELSRHAKAAFIMESSVGIVGADPDYIGGVKAGRYGRGNYTFHAHGTPYHSGINPTFADSALIELAQQAIRLENMTFIDRPNAETGERETVTVGCTALTAGNAGWPTVPGDGDLTIDARFSTVELAAKYDAIFRNMASFDPGVAVTTTGGLEKPPFDRNLPGNRALQDMAVKLGAEFGVEVKLGMVRGGSDGNFTASTGCPTLDGLGVTGSRVHQLGEYINVDHLPYRLAFCAELGLRVLER